MTANVDKFIILLTDRSLYKYSVINKKIWQKDLMDIHSVESGGSRSLIVTMRNKSVQTQINKKIANVQTLVSSDDYPSLLTTEIFEGEDAETKDVWLVLLQRVVRITNQKFWENTFVLAPEVYQWHLYCGKYNSKGKKQTRILLASTVRLYNVEVKGGLEIGKTKWAFPINALKSITVYDNNNTIFTISIGGGTQSGFFKTKNMKSRVSFETKDEAETNWVVADLNRLYWLQVKHMLTKEEESMKDIRNIKKGSYKPDKSKAAERKGSNTNLVSPRGEPSTPRKQGSSSRV